MSGLLELIRPVLERVSAEEIGEDAGKVTAVIYEMSYVFAFGKDKEIIVERADTDGTVLRTFFLAGEIERLEHVNMPFLELANLDGRGLSLSEQSVSDVALRLHLIMEGDIYMVEELVSYIGAGTQRSANYYRARR